MTGHLFEDITRNTTRIPEMEALDIPVKLSGARTIRTSMSAWRRIFGPI
jgi:hypothetical protein